MSPFELLEEIQKIEQEMGRRKVGSEKRWGPRIIDLDILAYGCEKVEADDLKIPHPRIQDRNFVLLPLREIEQFWIHPELKFSIDEMIHLCIDKCKVEHYLMPAEWVKWVK
jgi:2-amino-4-hydroxy-6-hydroxymethyldihydropteridine diphosphokinase